MGSPAPSEAPWRSTFLSQIEKQDSPVFVLSSLRSVGSSSSSSASSSSPAGLAPRARYVVFRGMWACLPVNPKNTADLNPDVYTTHLPTITADARMDKMPELMAGSTAASDPTKSGGGGPVESVFWFDNVKTQWRIRGRSYVIGPDIESDDAGPVRDALLPHMRRTGSGADASWSWTKELTAHFGNLSPMMRGSFRNPPSGTPLSQKPDESEGLSLGQKVTGLDDQVARANFRVVVVVPDEVDRVDLSDPERGRRWNYKLIGDEQEWKITELWP